MFQVKLETINQCRACLSSDDAFFSIFDDNLDEIYTKLTSLKVSKSDPFPKEICLACVQRLKAIKKFKKLCVKTHQIFTEESQAVSFMEQKVNDAGVKTVVDLSGPKISQSEKSLVPCPICGKDISCKKNLDRHMRTHSDEKDYKCQFCEKSFRASDTLAKHVNSQHTREKTYVCDLCARVFYCDVNLLAHKKSHLSVSRFQCNECEKYYKTKMSLKAHLLRHTGIRRHVCKSCASRFMTSSELRVHERSVHQKGEFRHECIYCGVKFNTKSLLDTHVRKHTDERPFACDVCHESFRRKTTLMKHQYRHTGERPFKCPVCPNAYTEAYYMRKHVKNVHPDVEI